MSVWLQRQAQGGAEPAAARRLGLVLPSHRNLDDLEPLLQPSIPAVDGVIVGRECETRGLTLPVEAVRKPFTERDLVTGRPFPAGAVYDVLLWLRTGETLLIGDNPGGLRLTAQTHHSTALLPVHYRWDTGIPLTLLGLEPRWVQSAAPVPQSMGFLSFPIEAEAPPPAEPPSDQGGQAWVLLYRANRALLAGDFQRGFSLLEHLYRHSASRLPAIAGVAVRNGLVGALAAENRQWLDRWQELSAPCRSYPEVQFIRAMIPYFNGDLDAAVKLLTRCLEPQDDTRHAGWISGGGERSYRALTARGVVNMKLGAAHAAVQDWNQSLGANPSYLPPLLHLARLRLHPAVLDQLGLRQYCLGRANTAVVSVARAYANSFDPEAAATVLASRKRLSVPKELRALVRQVSGGKGPHLQRRAGVQWEGPFFIDSSLARVNREIAARLIMGDRPVGIGPTEAHARAPLSTEQEQLLSRHLWRYAEQPAVTVRHCWPPLFRPVRSGRRITYLPWEFGAIPLDWVNALSEMDEVWVYSEWVRQGVVGSGINPDRVHVIPCGVDQRIFSPGDASPADPDGAFRFLYVGGTIARKGYDLALQAFLEEFSAEEHVTLTIKDFGSDTFYRGLNGRDLIREAAAATAKSPRRVVLIDKVLTDEELAALYRSATCLVAPYRAEGFCMPALESMACAVPAILPAFGPALDYAQPDNALLIPAEERRIGSQLDGMRLTGAASLCEVPIGALRHTMRWAVEHRDEVRTMGERAARAVAERFTWDHAARRAEERLVQFL